MPIPLFAIACINKKEKIMNYKVSIVIEKDEYGHYAYCPELEGCQTQGDSLEEVLANIKEANMKGDRRVIVPFHSGRILHPKVVKQVLKAIETSEK